MASAAQRASKVTTLKVGQVQVPVGWFSVEAKPGTLEKFDTAGPNGGVLKARQIARPTPETFVMEATFTEPAQGDPFASENEHERTYSVDAGEIPAAAQRGALHAAMVENASTESEAATQALAADAEEHARALGFVNPETAGVGVHQDVVEGEPAVLKNAGDSVTIYPEGSAERIKETGAQIDALAEALNHVQPGDAVEVTETISYSDGEYGRELVEDGSGIVVKPDEVRRGVRLEDGSFVDCTEQLAKIDEDTQLEGMEVVSFVDATQIHRLRVKASHYIGAVDGSSPKPLRLFYEAMRQTRRAAVVKVTKRSRQSLGALSVYGGVLVLYELIFASDVRDVPPRARVIQKAQVTEREVEMAVALVEAMSGTMDTLDALSDDAISRRAELKAQALAGGVVAPVAELGPTDEQSVLLAQLEASLAAA